jgi:hypothetical protein
LTPEQLSSFVWAYARCRHRSPRLLPAVADIIASRANLLPFPVLVQLLGAFADLRFPNSTAVAAMCDALDTREIPVHLIPSILWSFARRRPELQTRLELSIRLDPKPLSDVTPRYLGNLMWALGILQPQRSHTMSLVAHRMSALIGKSDPRSLASAVWALAIWSMSLYQGLSARGSPAPSLPFS